MIKLGAKLKTKTKKIKEELKFCPICEVPFKSLKEKNLFGKEIIMFYFCPICKFKTKDKKEVPIRYKIVFD